LLVQFKAHLKQLRFSIHTIWRHVPAVRQFLDYLRARHIEPERARRQDLSGFLEWRREEYRRQYGHVPKNLDRWRIRYTAPIRRFMRMLDPDWPAPEEPANENERFQREVCSSYIHWMREVRGLAKATVVKNGDEARQLLLWLGDRSNADTLRKLNVAAIDQYLESRMPGLRRATRVSTCGSMRSFLRYLHAECWIDRDLSRFITGPPVYAFAEIPRAFTEEQIRALLKTVRADRRPAALRDYAMLILLATYGIRGGEVVRLRLEDIDWRENRIRVRLSKTGLESYLPLVTPVGNALLNYLRHGRPPSSVREVFLRARAPYDPLVSSGSLVSIIRDRLKQAGIVVQGRRGAHAFRFARAASLLRASVSLKHIGDLLGHQSVAATGIYLRLTTDNLRGISLEVPGR
jgi:site-specific recombinase XerD